MDLLIANDSFWDILATQGRWDTWSAMLSSFIVAADPNGAVEAVDDVNDNSEDRSSTLSASVLGDNISCIMIKIWEITQF